MQSAKNDPLSLQSARNTQVGERFNRALFDAVDALNEAQVPFALIGGVASSGLGRPRATHDIDIFLSPDDAAAALSALAKKGFRTEKTDPNWLFKAFKEDILVDIIFRSSGEIYFDKEMSERAVLTEYHGRKIRTVAPEDLVIIKCAVHTEIGPHHWHDALSLLSHATIDWDYLLKRSRRAPRRLLALLLYAQSNDIGIPNSVIINLFQSIYEERSVKASKKQELSTQFAASGEKRGPHPYLRPIQTDAYLVPRIKDALAHDSRTCEQEIKVSVEGDRIFLRGEVSTEETKSLIGEVAVECAPGYQIENRIQVPVLGEPEATEDLG